jgi:hypothetical protein
MENITLLMKSLKRFIIVQVMIALVMDLTIVV